jgi:hypothetical protein
MPDFKWEIIHIVYSDPDRHWKVVVQRKDKQRIIVLYTQPALGQTITIPSHK